MIFSVTFRLSYRRSSVDLLIGLGFPDAVLLWPKLLWKLLDCGEPPFLPSCLSLLKLLVMRGRSSPYAFARLDVLAADDMLLTYI